MKWLNRGHAQPGSRQDFFMRIFPVHYAWVVLIFGTLGKIFTSPGQSPCIGVAIDEVRKSLNMTHTEMTSMYLAATTTSSILLPVTGILIDRLGPRIVVVMVSLGLACACFLMSIAQRGAHLFFTLLMLRFFGQGSLMNVSVTEINYWWVRKRGRAMGLAGAVVSAMMQGVIPVIMIALMKAVGWQGTYVWLGIATLTVMVPSGGLFFRGKPERYGLMPDGEILKEASPGLGKLEDAGNENNVTDTIEKDFAVKVMDSQSGNVLNSGHLLDHCDGSMDSGIDDHASDMIPKDTDIKPQVSVVEKNWMSKDVFKSPAFWAFALPDLVIAGTGTAFWFHLRAAFTDLGVSTFVLEYIYPTLAVVSVFGRLFSGWLIDRTSCKFVMVIGLILHSAGLAAVPLMGNNDGLAFMVALLVGCSGAFTSNVRSTVFASLFGRSALGKIQTVASSLTVLGSALGPFPFGVSRDVTGSWSTPFAVASIFPLLGAFVVFSFGNTFEAKGCCTRSRHRCRYAYGCNYSFKANRGPQPHQSDEYTSV